VRYLPQIGTRASRLRILVVRQSLPGKPNSRWARETHNKRHSKDGRLFTERQWARATDIKDFHIHVIFATDKATQPQNQAWLVLN